MLAFIFFALLFSLLLLAGRRRRSPATTPTPQCYPIAGNTIGLLLNLHRIHDWIADLFSGAGGKLTIKFHTFLNLDHLICTADPDNLRHIFRSNFQNYIKGSRLTDLDDLLGGGIFTADGHLWSVQRKIAGHEFSTRSIKTFISGAVQDEVSGRLLPFLYNACAKNDVVDLQVVFRKFAFDNICSVAFGVDLGCLHSDVSPENSTATDFASCFDDATEICMARMISPLPAIWKLKRFLCVGTERRLKEAIATIDDFAMEIIKSKEEKLKLKLKSTDEEKLDLLSRFMRSNFELEFKSGEEKTKFFRDIIVNFILAGKDTTSTALTWFFWLLTGHRRTERRIYDEINLLSGGGCKGNLNYETLKGMNHLHAALTESMRLFPPVPVNARLAVNDDVLPDGTRVRRGWAAVYSAYAMGRMESLWGADCREFRPERWLDGGGKFRPCEEFKFPVFHGGRRVCLGKDMAYNQMKAVAAAVIWRFEVVAVDGGATPEKMRSPSYRLGLGLRKGDGLLVKLRRRSN